MRLKWKVSLFLSCCCLIALVSGGSAAVLVESTFDVDADGWLVGNLKDFIPGSGTSNPTHVANGGNPGGFIRTNDIYYWTLYFAPAKFLGDQSAAFGGSLTFDQRIQSSIGINYYAVILEGNGMQIGYSAIIPGTDWTSLSIPLTGPGWLKDLSLDWTSGNPISAAELQGVLANLTALRLQADWESGEDQVDLDNVRLSSAAPVPASALLLASGLLGLMFGRRRK